MARSAPSLVFAALAGWSLVSLPLGCAQVDDAALAGADTSGFVEGDFAEEPEGGLDGSCLVDQAPPYPNGIPYVGIHGNAGNSDYIPCRTGGSWRGAWHGLKGLALTQPNTFSPDGQTLYATTTHPDPAGCRVHALDAGTGDVTWCATFPAETALGSVEVDSEGRLYLTAGDRVVALTARGERVWETPLAAGDSAWGLHFTPQGHIALVTSGGSVKLLRRADGEVLAELSIPETWGFVAPEGLALDIDPMDLLPEMVQRDIQSVWGEPTGDEQVQGFAAFLGSGAFVDNSVAVSGEGRLYVIGGGADEQHGALVQIRVVGPEDRPSLEPGWHAETVGGSATTPSISEDGRFVVVGDGAGPATLIAPGAARGTIKAYDIFACDANTDSDPDSGVCAPVWEEVLERAPLAGAPAILPDGAVVFYEMGLDFADPAEARDVVMRGPEGVRWSVPLPDDMDWMSVLTVTKNHILGTASRVERSGQGLPGLALPQTTVDRVVALDRRDGRLVWYADIPDDSAATVTVGPDGALYVGMLGILSILAIDDRPTLGLMRFDPVAGPSDLPPLGGHAAQEGGPTSTPPESEDEGDLEEGDDLEEGGEAVEGSLAGSQGESVGPAACFDVVLEEIPSCCDGGGGHCVDSAMIPPRFQSMVAACDEGGRCVPDEILRAHGSFTPTPCASVGGAEGACLSRCLPEVAANAALLPQDVCPGPQVCVPCVSPLDGQETGACGTLSCEAAAAPPGEPGPTGASTDEAVPAPGDGPRCCGGVGTCLDPGDVPAGGPAMTGSCFDQGRGDLVCVPDAFLGGAHEPPRCQATGGLGLDYEGVCLPRCLELPYEMFLGAGGCGAAELCMPCTDRLSGRPTGAPGC